MAEAKLPGLIDRAPDADWQRDKAEGQCKVLARELTLLWIRGSELYLTIVDTLQRGSLIEGMRFATACHTEMAMQLAML
jgi:hypothetical protein